MQLPESRSNTNCSTRKYFLGKCAIVLSSCLSLNLQLAVPMLTANAAEQDSTPTTNNSPANLEVLSLTVLRDLGILLRHMKQQSINIYREASRTEVSPKDSPDIPHIETIPYATGGKTFLPARQQWLVFFLGTMEPVARDMGKHVANIQSGQGRIIIPNTMRQPMEPLWNKWAIETQQLNLHMDQLLPLFDDAQHNSSQIQDKAVQIFNDVQNMELLRKQIYKIIQDNDKSGGSNKILITPPDNPLGN